MTNIHVMLSADGHWDVKDADDGEIISHHGDRDEAIRAATKLAQERDGAEVRIHEVEGAIDKRVEVEADGDVTEREGVGLKDAGGADEGGAQLGGAESSDSSDDPQS